MWIGSIRSYDGALLLLLIIDCICDWARDIYRLNIFRCLAGDDINMRDLTPAESTRSSHVDESYVSPSFPNHPTPRPTSPEIAIPIDLTTDVQDGDSEMKDAIFGGKDDGVVRSAIRTDYHPLLRFSISQNDSNNWSRHVTIRHSNLVYFDFRHFAIPEDHKEIKACLNTFGMDGGISHAAKCLLGLLDEKTAVGTTMDRIYELEQLWTRATPQISPRNRYPVRAQIMFNSHLRSKDWQLVRQISCLTGSPRAVKALSEIAGKSASSFSDPSKGQDCCCRGVHCLVKEARPLRSLSGGESMVCAASNLNLRLGLKEQDNTRCNFQWTSLEEAPEGHLDLWSALGSDRCSHGSISGLYQSSVLEEILAGSPVPPSLAPLITVHSWKLLHGAILMKKMSFWPGICPTFCFMVFDNTSFDNLPGLVEKIIRVWNSNYFFTGPLDRVRGSYPDSYAIEKWTDIVLESITEPKHAERPS